MQASTKYLFYPLSGPGGRLAVHPISAKGRMPVHPTGLSAGSDIMDFAVDPFDDRIIYVACGDAKIRIFEIPENLTKADWQCRTVLEGMRTFQITDNLETAKTAERFNGQATGVATSPPHSRPAIINFGRP